MVFLSAGLGYLYEYVGMISAMSAHFTIDLVLLILIRGYKLPQFPEHETSALDQNYISEEEESETESDNDRE